MANDTLSTAVEAVDEQISATRSAFGAPGDYGYETEKGKALYGLYKSQALLRAAMKRAPVASVIPCHRSAKCSWPACSADCDGRPGRPTHIATDAISQANEKG